MNIKKFTQKDRYGNTMSFEFDGSPKAENSQGHPGIPMGTDTVPAMLTPGEFVMNAESTRKYGPLLEALNNEGRAMQAAQGGSVPTQYKSAGGAIKKSLLESLIDTIFSSDSVPEPQDNRVPEPELPPEIIDRDYYSRPLDLPPEALQMYGLGESKAPQKETPKTPYNWINDKLLDQMAFVESTNNPNAVSPAGAQGMYQWMPHAAKDPGFGVEGGFDPFDPEASRRASMQYLRGLQEAHPDWTPEEILQAYNWGIGNMRKYKAGEITQMPKETKDYAGKFNDVIYRAPGGYVPSISNSKWSPESVAKRNQEKKLLELIGLSPEEQLMQQQVVPPSIIPYDAPINLPPSNWLEDYLGVPESIPDQRTLAEKEKDNNLFSYERQLKDLTLAGEENSRLGLSLKEKINQIKNGYQFDPALATQKTNVQLNQNLSSIDELNKIKETFVKEGLSTEEIDARLAEEQAKYNKLVPPNALENLGSMRGLLSDTGLTTSAIPEDSNTVPPLEPERSIPNFQKQPAGSDFITAPKETAPKVTEERESVIPQTKEEADKPLVLPTIEAPYIDELLKNISEDGELKAKEESFIPFASPEDKATYQQALREGSKKVKEDPSAWEKVKNYFNEISKDPSQLFGDAVDLVKESGVIDGKLLTKMAILYLGGRALGNSHTGTLNWAGKQYISTLQARDEAEMAAKAKRLENTLQMKRDSYLEDRKDFRERLSQLNQNARANAKNELDALIADSRIKLDLQKYNLDVNEFGLSQEQLQADIKDRILADSLDLMKEHTDMALPQAIGIIANQYGLETSGIPMPEGGFTRKEDNRKFDTYYRLGPGGSMEFYEAYQDNDGRLVTIKDGKKYQLDPVVFEKYTPDVGGFQDLKASLSSGLRSSFGKELESYDTDKNNRPVFKENKVNIDSMINDYATYLDKVYGGKGRGYLYLQNSYGGSRLNALVDQAINYYDTTKKPIKANEAFFRMVDADLNEKNYGLFQDKDMKKPTDLVALNAKVLVPLEKETAKLQVTNKNITSGQVAKGILDLYEVDDVEAFITQNPNVYDPSEYTPKMIDEIEKFISDIKSKGTKIEGLSREMTFLNKWLTSRN